MTGKNGHGLPWKEITTWDEILTVVGPDLLQWVNDNKVSSALTKGLLFRRNKDLFGMHVPMVDDEPFKTVRLQMMALQYVDVRSLTTVSKATALFWTLTAKGKERLMQLRTVRTSKPKH